MSFKSSLMDPLSKLASLLSPGEYCGYLAMCWKRQHITVRSDGLIWGLSPQPCKNATLSRFLRHTALPLHPAETHNPQIQEQGFILAAVLLFQQRMEIHPQQGWSRGRSWGTELWQCFLAGDNFTALPEDTHGCARMTELAQHNQLHKKTAWLQWHHELGKTASAP